jgi:hypothetical protein
MDSGVHAYQVSYHAVYSADALRPNPRAQAHC